MGQPHKKCSSQVAYFFMPETKIKKVGQAEINNT